MADKTKTAVEADQKEQAVEAAKPGPTVYTAAELIAAAPQVFKVSSAIAAGALYGVPAATKEEAKKLIEKFTKKVVKGAK